jgi:hypothetical protein
MTDSHEAAKDDEAKMVEFLQAEHRKLQIKTNMIGVW